jgi:hypothetical protein
MGINATHNIFTMKYTLSAELQSMEDEVFNHYINTDTTNTDGEIICPSIISGLTNQEQLQIERNLKERITDAKHGYNIDSVSIRWNDGKTNAIKTINYEIMMATTAVARTYGLLTPFVLPLFGLIGFQYVYYLLFNGGQTIQYRVVGRPSGVE